MSQAKLVRDKIPQITRAEGSEPVRSLSSGGYAERFVWSGSAAAGASVVAQPPTPA